MKSLLPDQAVIKSLLVYKDGDLIWLARGCGRFDKQFAGKVAGSKTHNGYKIIRFNEYGLIMSHVLIWIYHNGDIPKGYDIDHIDNDRLNNNITNLRLAKRGENLYNSKIRKDNESGVKGVSWNAQNQNWRAKINVDKAQVEIGSFPTKELAAIAVREARAKYHGDYSRHAVREGSL